MKDKRWRMTTTYTTINGMLVHESRGGVESFYFPDTLGSLTTVRSATGVKTYGAEYWPYGEIQTETGTNPSPWSFVGLLGYLRDTASRIYVRARHYRPGLARWQTVDPLWPGESAYGYVGQQPVYRVDPTGMGDKCFIDDIWQWLVPKGIPQAPIVMPDWLRPLRHFGEVTNFNYFKWKWGNCCGLDQKCGPAKSNGSCADNACEKHDKCVGPDFFPGAANWRSCAAGLCSDLKKCYKKNGCASQVTPSSECQAAWEAGVFFCMQAGMVFES